MTTRPNATALKRSLFAAVCLFAIASATVPPASTHTAAHVGGAARTAPANVVLPPGRPHSIARTTPDAQPLAVATAVALAYARYLADQLPAQRLPALSPRTLAIARYSGPLPARLHVTQVQLTGLTGAGKSWTAHFTIIDTRGRQATTAQLVLAATAGPWQVAELIAPDPDTLLNPPQPSAPLSGPAAARRAALAFTNSYLNYTYGHAAASQLHDLTPELRAAITANSPRVPATMHALHPGIATLALTPYRRGWWLADANVTDGQDTYQVISLVGRTHREWLVVALKSAG
jgi:hypothetical protein